LIDCIQNSSVPPPSRFEPNVPHDLETIVLKATEKTPERRYPTAEAFAEDLRHFLAGRPIVARRTTWSEQGWLWCRRNPIVASLATAIAVLLVAITVVATFAAVAAREHARDLAMEKARVEAAELRARRRLFDSYVNEARAVHWSGRPGRRFDSLAAIGKAAELLPALDLAAEVSQEKKLLLRNHAIAGLSLSDLQLRETWTAEGRMTAFAFDANVERFARGDMQGNISIHRAATNKRQLLLPGFELPVWGITFSRDGRHLAARYEDYSPAVLKVWSLETERVLFEVDPVVNKPAVDFSPNGDRVAIARREGTVEIYELPSGQIVAKLPEKASANHLQFSPDGTRLAITSFARHNESFGVAVWDLITRQRGKLLTHSGTHRIAWSHDGKLLAAADDTGIAYVWNVENKQQLFTLGPHDQPLIQVSFNATDHLLAICTWRKTFLCDAATGEEQLSADGQCQHFSADDQWLAFRQGSQLGRWKVNAGSERRVVRVDEPLRGLHATKQGWGLLAAAGVGGIDVLDARRGRKLAHLPGLSLAALFDPDGNELITSGELGVFRWPIQYASDDKASKLLLGAPRKLLEPTGSGATGLTGRVDQSGDHRLVVASKNRARIIELQSERTTSTTGDQENLHYVALSPNGQWLASGTWNGRGVKVWAANSGRLLTDLLTDCSHARVFFSPDGRWLVVGTGGKLCFFEVPTWRLARELPRQDAGTFPGAAAFTHDGSVVAFALSPRRLQLVETGTWQVVSELELSGGNVESLCFTDADRRLAAATSSGVVIWDMQGIRRTLQQFDLDWGSPPGTLVDPLQAGSAPVNMAVELGSYGTEYESLAVAKHGMEQAKLGEWEAAITSLEQAITTHPRNALAQNALARLLSTCPDDAFRDPVRAVEHAERAVQVSSDAAAHWNTLGMALYRSNQWLAAIEALEHSQAIDPVTYLGHNGYLLTMAYWKIGKPDMAQTWFDQARGAVGHDDTAAEELRRLVQEVTDVCGFVFEQ
jgi:WD40 repeat protein